MVIAYSRRHRYTRPGRKRVGTSARSILKLFTAGVFLVIAGCNRQQPVTPGIIRLMPPTTEESASHAKFWEEREVFRWEFKTEEDLDQWEARRIGKEFSLKPEGLYMRASSADPALVRRVSLDSKKIHAIRVVHSGLTSGANTQIYWTRPGEDFSEKRSMATDHPDPNGTVTPTFTFEVFRHSLWTGTIDQFRLDPISVANRRMQINSISGIEYVISEELLNKTLEKAWRIDLGGDVRYAVLVPPSRPHVRTLKIPAGSTLEFALSSPPIASVDIRFKISWHPENGAEEKLFDETLIPHQEGNIPKWVERSVDLTRFSGRTGQLVFSTNSSEILNPLMGIPAFANISVGVHGGASPQKNVVLIIVDTLRADGLSCYGNTFETSPRIDSWASNQGVLFEKVVAQAPWTLPSHVSIFTGMDPLHHSMNVGEPIDETLTTLAERLRGKGYVTVAFTGGGYLSSDYALMQGFDRVNYFFESQLQPRETGNDLSSGMDRTLHWLDQNTGQPFLLLFHTYEVHAPYRPREPYISRFLGVEPGSVDTLITTGPVEPSEEKGYVLTSKLMQRYFDPNPHYEPIGEEKQAIVPALYASSVANVDAHLGRLFDKLEGLGLQDKTMVVLTSDHGEALGESGLAGHATLQECEILVPLIVAAPGLSARGTRITKQVQSIDITPTILDFLDLDPLQEADGISLVPFLSGIDAEDTGDAITYAGSSNFGLSVRRANQLKYLFNNSPWPATQGAEELYDLEHDPNTSTNIATTSAETARFRQSLRVDFEQRFTGVRIRLVNEESTSMQATIKGWLVNPLRTKTFDITTDRIKWYNQRLNLSLAPKESVTFFLEGNALGELQLVCSFDGPPGSSPPHLNRTLVLNQLGNRWQALLQDNTWIEPSESSDVAGTTGVRVWLGGLRTAVRSTGEINEETREQLRQLGYVVN